MRKIIFSILLASGCASGEYAATGTVSTGYYDTPDMAYVEPGVQVLVDYDEPVFYTNGSYWRYSNNYWYRSPTYTGGWVYASPPRSLLRIERPHAYVRYRPQGYVSRHPARVYRDRDARNYRDHRRDRRGTVYRR